MINRAELMRRLRAAIRDAEAEKASGAVGLYAALGIVQMMTSQRTSKPKSRTPAKGKATTKAKKR